jgi:vacuolar-type H+-ATPase subunit D/Vma8
MTIQELQMERIRTELNDLRAEVHRLKTQSAQCDDGSTRKFDEYLEKLEDKRDQLLEHLNGIKESGDDAWTDIAAGLKEARERLAIAKTAAKSRFH